MSGLGSEVGEYPFPSKARSPEERALDEQVSRESAGGMSVAHPLVTSTWPDLEQLAVAAPIVAVVEKLIFPGDRVLLYGHGAVGKSLLSQELALAIQRGEPFLGAFATQRLRVGIIDEESPSRMLGARLRGLRLAHAIDGASMDELPIWTIRSSVRLDTDEGQDRQGVPGGAQCAA